MAFGIWSYAIRIGVWQADSSMDNCTWGFSWLNSPVSRMGRSMAKKQAVTSLLEGNGAGGVGGAVIDGLPAPAAAIRSHPIRPPLPPNREVYESVCACVAFPRPGDG